MCIPCVMCGACMNGAAPTVRDGRCPSCGEEVPPDAVSCPFCYTFLGAPSATGTAGNDANARDDAENAPAE